MRPLALSVVLAWSGSALANPSGPQVAAGAASFQAAGKNLTITNAPGTIINWQSFSIGSGEHTRFVQPSAASAVLNRVVGTDASSILGSLSSNGRVFLVNPHGIVFGPGARVDTAALVASTLNITDRDFLAGRLRFEGGGNGVLRNEGVLRASGDIMLVGPAIENAGLIRSDNGSVLLAAGREVTITSPDAQGVKFALQAPTDSAINVGSVHAGNAAAVFAGTLSHSGDIRATTASLEGGRVVLSAQKDALVQSGGVISVASVAGRGGDVQVLGERVAVEAGALIDASGRTGGGTLRIGGDFQGRNPEVKNSRRTLVAAGAALRADALESGDGGRVIVWSDGNTGFYGQISARGGARGGDGGFVETSGKTGLSVVGGVVDTRAPAGRTGSWLLDPIIIRVASTGGAFMLPGDFTDVAIPEDIVHPSAIADAFANVILQANTDIFFDEAVSMANPGIALTAQAGRSIVVGADITTLGGDVNLVANETAAAGVLAGFRAAGPGGITMAPATTINAGAGNIVLRVAAGSSGAASSGDVVVSRLTGANVSVVHEGPTAGGSILRSDALSLITGSSSVHLRNNAPDPSARIGTPAQPIRIDTPAVEAQTVGGSGGIFLDSPNPRDLQIGGVPITLYSGAERGVQTLNGGPIEIRVNGNLTRFAGTFATCGSGGGTGGPICANNGDIALAAAEIGSAAVPVQVDTGGGPGFNTDPHGTVTATTTVGGIFLRRRHLPLDTSGHFLLVPPGQPIGLFADSRIAVDASMIAPGSTVTLTPGTDNMVSFHGVTIDAQTLNVATSGAGVVRIVNGTNTINAAFSSSSPVAVDGGTLVLAREGTDTGAYTIAPAATLRISGATRTFDGTTLDNAGTVVLSGASDLILNNGATLTNSGVFDFQSDAGIRHVAGAAANFANTGEVRKSGGAGTTVIESNVSFTHAATALVDVRSGTLRVENGPATNDGTINIRAGATYSTNGAPLANAGTLRGSGTLDLGGQTLTNSGTLQPGGSGVGTLTVAGSLAQAPGGRLDIDLTGTAVDQIDRLAITGAAALAGTLNVQHVDGFAPPSDSSYTILTFGSRTGDFATKNFPAGYGVFYNSAPNASDYLLSLGTITNAWVAPGSGTWQTAANWSLGHAPTLGEDAVIADLGAPGPTASITVSQPGQRARKLTSAENVTVASGGELTLGALSSQVDATLAVDGGTLILNGPLTANVLSLSGATGTLDVRSGALPRLSMSEGLLTRSTLGDVTIAGPFSVSGGSIGLLAGAFVTAGTTTLSGSVDATSNWRNTGLMNWVGGRVSPSPGAGFSFTNAATGVVNITTPDPNPFASAIADATIVNAGTINKNAGSAATQTIDTAISNSGTLRVNAGTLVLPTITNQSGSIRIAAGATLSTDGAPLTSTGVIGGKGTLDLGGATLTSLGQLQPGKVSDTDVSRGTLTVIGDVALAPGGSVLAGISGALSGQYDVLNVQGSAALAGPLTLSPAGSTYVPVAGDSFTLLEAASLSGTFSTVQNLTGWTNALNPSYAPGSASVSIDAPPLNFWLPNTSGDWSDSTRWSLGVVPTAAHLAKIERPNALTITVPAGVTASPDRLRSEENVVVNGTLDLANASRFNATLAVNAGGTLQGAGSVTVNGPLALDGGTLASAGGVTANGTSVWSGGTLNGALTQNGTLTLNGPLALAGGATLTNSGTVTSRGALTLAAGSTFRNTAPGRFNLNPSADNSGITGAGTFQNDGTVSASAAGLTALIGSVFNNAGTTNVDAGTLKLTGGGAGVGAYAADAGTTLEFAGGAHSVGTVGTAGNLVVSAGTLSANGAVTTTGGLTISGGVADFNAASTIGGASALSGGTLQADASVTINNSLLASAGTLAGAAAVTVNGTTTVNTGGMTVAGTLDSDAIAMTAGTLTVTGTLVASGGGASSVSGGTVNNAGTLRTLGGSTLTFSDTATLNNNGTLDAPSGAIVYNATQTFNAGTRFSGAALGNRVLASSTFNGAIATTNLSLEGGNHSGTATLAGTTAWSGGGIGAAFTIPAGSSLNATAAGLTHAGTLTLAGTLALSNNATVTNTGAVESSGVATIDAGSIFRNVAGGTFNLSAPADSTAIAGAGTFENAGALAKSAGTGTASVGAVFNNTGAVNATAGNLRFTAGGVDSGTYAAANDTSIAFGGGTRALNAGSRLETAGNGKFVLDGSTLEANTPIAVRSFDLLSGTLSGTGAGLTLTGSGTWSGGTLAGSLSVAAGATLRAAADALVRDGGLFENSGTLVLEGASRVVLGGAGPATLVNRGSGTIVDRTSSLAPITTAGSTRSGKSFVNAGTFEKTAAAATEQTLDVPATNTGTINVLAGTLAANGLPANGGIVDVAPGATFSTAGAALTNNAFGLLRGNGTFSANVINNGTVAPGTSPGTLTIAGDYVQGAAGTLVLELGGATAGTDYDVLRVTGGATLGGTLVVTRSAGLPLTPGSAFAPITYASRTGDFAAFSVPSGVSLRAAPGPNVYALNVPPVVSEQTLATVTALAQKDAVLSTDRVLVTQTPANSDAEAERRALQQCR